MTSRSWDYSTNHLRKFQNSLFGWLPWLYGFDTRDSMVWNFRKSYFCFGWYLDLRKFTEKWQSDILLSVVFFESGENFWYYVFLAWFGYVSVGYSEWEIYCLWFELFVLGNIIITIFANEITKFLMLWFTMYSKYHQF